MTEADEDLLHFEQLADETWPLAKEIIDSEQRLALMPKSSPRLKLEKHINNLKREFSRALQRDTAFEQFSWPEKGWMVRFEAPATDGKNKLRHPQPPYSAKPPSAPPDMPMLEMVRGLKPVFSRIER
jgi:hypothetical protein